MIAGMNHQWEASIERLAELDRSQAFVELDIALKALPGDVPDAHRAAVAHWRGKVALVNDAIAEAIPQLALAASLGSDRAKKLLGRFSGFNRIKVPASTSSSQSLVFSSSEPSTQWMAFGWQSSAISATQDLSFG